MSGSNWLEPQHPYEFTDIEEASPDDQLAETIEACVRYAFRQATNAQVDAVTRGIRRAAISYAEAWAREHPRRQIPFGRQGL